MIQASVGLSERFSAEQIPQTAERTFLKCVLEHRHDKVRHPFHRLQGHIAGKTIAHYHIELTAADVSTLYIADIIQRTAGKLIARGPCQIVSLPLFFAVAEHAYPGTRNTQNPLGVDRTHEGELNQMARLAVDVGPGIDDHGRARHRGHDHKDSRPFHVRQIP